MLFLQAFIYKRKSQKGLLLKTELTYNNRGWGGEYVGKEGHTELSCVMSWASGTDVATAYQCLAGTGA